MTRSSSLDRREERFEHVLTPAAQIVWSENGSIIDARGERDLSPKTDDDWEKIISGAATLVEATNALMIPERAQDAQWKFYVKKLADAGDKAYEAAEAHDLKSVAEVSDRLDGICGACHRHYGNRQASLPGLAPLRHAGPV